MYNDPSAFHDEGRKFGIQHEGTSMVVYKPMHIERAAVKSAKLSVMIPCHFFEDFEIYAGDLSVSGFSFASAVPVPVFVRAYKSCFAFIPLTLTDFGREAAVKITKENEYLMISFYNYEGVERSFEIKELVNAQSGFVCIAKTLGEAGTFGAFMDYAKAAVIQDYLELSAKMYTRRVKYSNRDVELNFVHNPETESCIVYTANKKPKGMHIFKEDMINREIPFL
jgi:hypothetical protein